MLPDLSWIRPSGFHFFGFRNNFFTQQSRHPWVQTPNLEDQVPVLMSPNDRVAQLYPQALRSLFFAFHDSQGYGGGILIRLHMGYDKFSSTYI
jgi:hypothetical protein